MAINKIQQNAKKRHDVVYAFIDSQNLNLAIQDLGWKLDYKRFRIYLEDKFGVSKAFLCIGYIKGNEPLYDNLKKSGYILVFKTTLEYSKNRKIYTKGNVDAELVLHAMIEYPKYRRAVIVSGDGDFHCLIEYLHKMNKLERVLVPNFFKFSALLRKFMKKLVFLNRLQAKLEYKKERH